MKRLVIILPAMVFLLALTLPALADSSGSFTATGLPITCTATPAIFSASTCTNNGQCISGLSCVSGLCTGAACDPNTPCPAGSFCNSSGVCEGIGGFFGNTLNGGLNIPGQFTANIQTPNGQGTTLLIRPSMVTGLFTANKLTTTINNATADVGIQVCVLVDPTLDAQGNPVEGTGLTVNPTQCVIYDQRIQQVSNTLFGNLANCIPPPISTTPCTADSDCPSGDICTVGFCQAPAPACSFEMLTTTLSAHSFDYVVPVGNGVHQVFMTWKLLGPTVPGTTAACVGPAEVTVQQVKGFKNNSPISFTNN